MEPSPSASDDFEELVARLKATVRRWHLPAGVPWEECVQEAVLRWLMWLDCHRPLSAEERRKVAFGILRHLRLELRRKGAFGAGGLPCDPGVDVSQMPSKAVAGGATEGIVREEFESWLKSRLDPRDANILLAVRLDRMDWRSAAQSQGVVGEKEVEAARKRISRFLSDPGVLESCRRWFLSLSLSLSLSGRPRLLPSCRLEILIHAVHFTS